MTPREPRAQRLEPVNWLEYYYVELTTRRGNRSQSVNNLNDAQRHNALAELRRLYAEILRVKCHHYGRSG